ncbi:MAG: M23 family metallopeptidase [Rhodanobacteraceae bacterium]|jgi:hypothetical protein|nr:M23 family metallopeptidase [Rhodanobacteraceae bacterium]
MYTGSFVRRRASLPACLAILLGWAGMLPAAALEVAVQRVPAPLPTTAGTVLVYELNVRNPDAACARLADVRAEGGSGAAAIVQRYQGPVIAANATVYTAAMDGVPRAATVDVPPGGGAALFFFLRLSDGAPAPATLRHRIAWSACADGAPLRTLDHEFAVADTPPVLVGLPFRGTGWVAGDSPNAGGIHRRTLIRARDAAGQLVPGRFYVPERYAIDWVVVDAEARRALPPLDQNAGYLAYGKEIIAVADGVIARTRDGMGDQVPPYPPSGQTEQTAAGNYVMQDIGGGHYAFYAHLQPGSLRVREGQTVRRGQVLALLGNTGNSTEAHLHFHVSDAVDPLASEGVPFAFDAFEATGRVDGMDEENGLFDDYAAHAPVARAARMPASFEVLDAPPVTASRTRSPPLVAPPRRDRP